MKPLTPKQAILGDRKLIFEKTHKAVKKANELDTFE